MPDQIMSLEMNSVLLIRGELTALNVKERRLTGARLEDRDASWESLTNEVVWRLVSAVNDRDPNQLPDEALVRQALAHGVVLHERLLAAEAVRPETGDGCAPLQSERAFVDVDERFDSKTLGLLHQITGGDFLV